MKKIYLLLLGISILSCNKNSYTPVHSDKWAVINDSVKQQWTAHSGNCTHGKWCNCIALPDTFAFATWCGLTFYWDVYYTQAGLLAHGKVKLAKGGVNNLLFLADTLGYVPNASANWGLKRSQPPYLSLMVAELYPEIKDKEWLRNAYRILMKEYYFWTNSSDTAVELNRTAIDGLQRYFHQQTDSASCITMYNDLMKRIESLPDTTEEAKAAAGSHFLAEAESGMDFTTRFEHRCADFIPVDLNANLYHYEVTLAVIERELNISDGKTWDELAGNRRDLINKYCWDEEKGVFMDYDYINNRRSKVMAATSFSPMLTGMASPEQAERMVENLHLLESDWGIITTTDAGEKQAYQWDHHSIWPPMQTLVIKALDRYGYKEDAVRIAMKYLDIAAANFYNPSPSTFQSRKDEAELKRPLFRIYEKYAVEGVINNLEYTAGDSYGWSLGAYAYAYVYVMKSR